VSFPVAPGHTACLATFGSCQWVYCAGSWINLCSASFVLLRNSCRRTVARATSKRQCDVHSAQTVTEDQLHSSAEFSRRSVLVFIPFARAFVPAVPLSSKKFIGQPRLGTLTVQ
jgi:hypothetical protein